MKKALLGGVAAVSLAATAANADPAFWTNDFISQVCVNAHVGQTPHNTDPNYPLAVAAALKATGIRCLRTGAPDEVGSTTLINMAAQVPGLTYDILTARMHGPSTAVEPIWQRLTDLSKAGLLRAAEGSNEPNTAGPNGYASDRPDGSLYATGCGNGPPATWTTCSQYQRDFYTMVHNGFMGAGPFPGTVVYGPSETGANPPGQWYGVAENTALDPSRMAGLTPYTTSTWPDTGANVIGTQFSDFVTTHNYASGNSAHTYQDNFAYLSMLPNDPVTGAQIVGIDGWYQNHENGWWQSPNGFKGYVAAEAPSIPSVTTETSSFTVDRTLTSPVGSGAKTVDQVTQGIIALDLYLDYFKVWGNLGAGAGAGMYWYEWADADDSSANQGLFPAYNGTATIGPNTPAATFISNMISIMTDPGPRPSLGVFNFTVSDKNQICTDSTMGTVHSQLFQQGSKFMIAVWDERSSNQANAGDVVTITFGDHLSHSWTMYDPTKGTAAQSTGNGTSIAAQNFTNHPKFFLINN